MLLAGDIGATKTRLSIFSKKKERVFYEEYRNKDYPEFFPLVGEFLEKSKKSNIETVCLGVAGPVRGGVCQTTNFPWIIDIEKLRQHFGMKNGFLINDLEANAWGIRCLKEEEFLVMNDKQPERGNAALIAAGTGLGEAGLFWDGKNHIPFATEGGHCDFAPLNQRDVELFHYLKKFYAHISYERILRGKGILLLYQFLVDQGHFPSNPSLEKRFRDGDAAELISEAAIAGTCKTSIEALEWFITIYGSESGNLALKMFSQGGFYIGGGIAPKIAPMMIKGNFMEAFCAKGRFENLLKSFPVKIILNEHTPLLGAVEYAHKQL